MSRFAMLFLEREESGHRKGTKNLASMVPWRSWQQNNQFHIMKPQIINHVLLKHFKLIKMHYPLWSHPALKLHLYWKENVNQTSCLKSHECSWNSWEVKPVNRNIHTMPLFFFMIIWKESSNHIRCRDPFKKKNVPLPLAF